MSPGIRRLVLVRHAKAESQGPSDHGRVLSARGRADAAEAGDWLRKQGIVPDAALVSDAARTTQTWAAMAASAGWGIEPELSAALYDAGPESVFDLLRETRDQVATLVVIGHNPTVAYLAELIEDGDGDADAIAALLSQGFPPCTVSVFRVAEGWSHLGEGSGAVESLHVGRG